MRWVLFSEQCRCEDHQHCTGKNEFAVNAAKEGGLSVTEIDTVGLEHLRDDVVSPEKN
jgi:hypothetical protein